MEDIFANPYGTRSSPHTHFHIQMDGASGYITYFGNLGPDEGHAPGVGVAMGGAIPDYTGA